VVDERPTYGYRRVTALVNRLLAAEGKPTANHKRIFRIMKQQGELKLAAMDILKQYRNISNSVSAYVTSTSITNGLQQYFMLTFAYYPRKFGKRATEGRGE